MAKKNRKSKESDEKKQEKKSKQEETPRQKKKKEKEKQNLYVMWFLVFMIVLVIAFVGFSYYYKYKNKSDSNFSYIGLNFTKTKFGEIPIYVASIPVERSGQIIGSYNITLLNDPRELGNVSLDLHDDKLSFYKYDPVYITISADIEPCNLTFGSVASLSEFLRKFALLDIEAGISDEIHANETGFEYVTCENKPDNTVLHISSGDETSITKVGKTCYEMVFTNCEINQLTERFIVEIMDRYMQHFNEKMKEYEALRNNENKGNNEGM